MPDGLESFAISEDGRTMTLVLPEGARFTSGAPLDAAALKAAIERYVAISPYKFDYDGLGEMRTLDPRTLQIDNANGFNVMLPTLMTSFGAAWDTKAAEAMGNDAFAANPVGSGPFAIARPWTAGLDLELARNDGYSTRMPMVENKGPMHLESATIRFIADAQTRANELEAGTVDLVVGLPATALNWMKDDPDYRIFQMPQPGILALTFNTSRPPFDDAALRKALAMAVDRDQMALALEGAAVPQGAFVTEAMIAHHPAAADDMQSLYPTDPAGAKAALAAAGWADSNGDGTLDRDGTELEVGLMLDSGNTVDTAVVPVLQAQLAAVGVGTEIARVDTTALYETMRAGNFDLALSGYIWADPDILTYRFVGADSVSRYTTEALTQALTEARSIADPKARAEAYLAVQKTIMDAAPMVPLLTETLTVAARAWVEGLKVQPPMQILLNDVRIVE
ncbi:MAG: ABC transporter substrate-binding protein [Rhodobacteraceae bacterium]|nr:ABC transporter substrate-binding protein [Paracoccaceae bacterium]